MSQDNQETEEVQVSQVPQDQLVPPDPLEGLDGMVCLDYQVNYNIIKPYSGN